VGEQLTGYPERARWILAEIDRAGGIKAPDIMRRFGVSRSTADRDVSALRASGEIEFVGGPRYGRYERA
jgi:DeoR/GlpR family transcriptional regulator of sugar metabolism